VAVEFMGALKNQAFKIKSHNLSAVGGSLMYRHPDRISRDDYPQCKYYC
jgi:hypothetical protein